MIDYRLAIVALLLFLLVLSACVGMGGEND
jgi:predicted small secreted protein